MADPFHEALSDLVERCPVITGAVFADLDGEDIAVHGDRDTLRLCAAYSGIALRRLTAAEERTGRQAVQHLVLHGSKSELVSLRVGDAYQLVVALAPGAPSGRALFAAGTTVTALEDQI